METEIKSETADNINTPIGIAEQNELLRRNLEVSEKILEETEDIKKYIKWQKIWSVVRLLIILIPIVIGLLFLPPLIKNYVDQFSSLYK